MHGVAIDKSEVALYAARKGIRWLFLGKYEAAADDALRCVFRCSAYTDLLSVSVYVSEACTARIFCDEDAIYDGTDAFDEGSAGLSIICTGAGWFSLPFQRLTAAADTDSCALQPAVSTAETDLTIWIRIDAGILSAAIAQELSYASTSKSLV
jgi:hypothetical protein